MLFGNQSLMMARQQSPVKYKHWMRFSEEITKSTS